ncbi:hypothetical protein [Methyloceanibacter sp.]|nr:hypothetical protein [Methyloceanibacter sp.]HML92909.1 hypothetical protein [Methyloceanibacter sp.]
MRAYRSLGKDRRVDRAGAHLEDGIVIEASECGNEDLQYDDAVR